MAQLELFLLRDPRTLILASGPCCLVFKKPPQDASPLSVVVELLPRSEVDLDSAVLLNARVYGCLGVFRTGEETFLPMITSATNVGAPIRSFTGYGVEPVSRVLSVEFFCLTSATWDGQSSVTLDYTNQVDSFEDQVASTRPDLYEHPCAPVKKILSAGTFYYSSHFDLSTRLQARISRAEASNAAAAEKPREGDEPADESLFDTRFMWNSFLVKPLLDFRSSLPDNLKEVFDKHAFVVLAIQGYCGVYDITLGGFPAVLSVISRLGSKRAGTRFNVRGVDDDGSVANFVETETILRTQTTCFSYVQTRGSVPVFWEETGTPLAVKISVTRPLEASLPAFIRHFDDMMDTYESVHCINLLSSKDGEAALTSSYSAHLSTAGQIEERLRQHVSMTEFDFHAKSRLGGIESVKSQLASLIGDAEQQFGACLINVEKGGAGSLVIGQQGVFRTNCKDCLDRTNVVEDILSRFALENFMLSANPAWQGLDSVLWNAHRTLFAENGDALSKIYVGTGAINTSFTRSGKSSLAGLISNATKSVGRMYQSQFIDAGKQRAIDALLGNLASSQRVRVFNPINDLLHARLRERVQDFTSFEDVTLWVGTYNLNGKGPSSESLLPWFFPNSGPEPAMIVIGFQEIVPLTPAMVMATDPEKKPVEMTLADRPGKQSDYVLLRSGQLVGTALIVLIRVELANEIRNVEAATKKTGLKGMAGNKGAVAIRLEFRDTSFCFITAHLAAGHSNVDERNADYFTIAQGLHFSRGRNIASHDNVIWAADTNYRISLANEDVRHLAEADDYATLLESDQLLMSMRTRGVFSGYCEAPILFRPTYMYIDCELQKYDNFSDNYDTSEKQRIPAWTDRILYAGRDIDVNRYQRAELKTSDHRPVYALFRAKIRAVDIVKKTALRKELLADIVAHSPKEKLEDKLSRLTSELAVSSDLPPPSDDQQAWWNDADGSFKPLEPVTRPRNPAVTNPFDPTFFLKKAATAVPVVPPKPITKFDGNPAFSAVTLDEKVTNGDSLVNLDDHATTDRAHVAHTRQADAVGEKTLLDEQEEGELKSWQVI
ncbi:Inositol-1,4,5-trisphosphate 5-phosphatase 1 [Microbotryomycetes sp. JL201]|nr:Inositol-1,4,5-trisphosphate 5-phosphatase 1 [Microbotryomycetes sp. JL201]